MEVRFPEESVPLAREGQHQEEEEEQQQQQQPASRASCSPCKWCGTAVFGVCALISAVFLLAWALLGLALAPLRLCSRRRRAPAVRLWLVSSPFGALFDLARGKAAEPADGLVCRTILLDPDEDAAWETMGDRLCTSWGLWSIFVMAPVSSQWGLLVAFAAAAAFFLPSFVTGTLCAAARLALRPPPGGDEVAPGPGALTALCIVACMAVQSFLASLVAMLVAAGFVGAHYLGGGRVPDGNDTLLGALPEAVALPASLMLTLAGMLVVHDGRLGEPRGDDEAAQPADSASIAVVAAASGGPAVPDEASDATDPRRAPLADRLAVLQGGSFVVSFAAIFVGIVPTVIGVGMFDMATAALCSPQLAALAGWLRFDAAAFAQGANSPGVAAVAAVCALASTPFASGLALLAAALLRRLGARQGGGWAELCSEFRMSALLVPVMCLVAASWLGTLSCVLACGLHGAARTAALTLSNVAHAYAVWLLAVCLQAWGPKRRRARGGAEEPLLLAGPHDVSGGTV